MKLPKSQQELLDAMQAGAVLNFMPYFGRFNPQEYYYRSDTHRRCTAPAKALLAKGLVERFDMNFRGHKLRLVTRTAEKSK